MHETNFRCHVLSIRDDAAGEYLLRQLWSSDAEIEITSVHCGREALEYLRAPNRPLPNLILLAWWFHANQMSALETLDALKADPAFRRVPVVVLASSLSAESIANLYDSQVACVLEMPYDLSELEKMMQTVKQMWMNLARLPYQKTVGSN